MINFEEFKAKRLLIEQKRKEAEKKRMRLERNPFDAIMKNKKKRLNDCWEWTGKLTKSGYGYIRYKGLQWRAHRLSYLLFKGDYNRELFVCHKCDNPKCVNPEHLFLGTCKDNTRDSIDKGRFYQKYEAGNKPQNRLISDKKARAIKATIKGSNCPLTWISEYYKVPYQLVKDIKGGRSYKNV